MIQRLKLKQGQAYRLTDVNELDMWIEFVITNLNASADQVELKIIRTSTKWCGGGVGAIVTPTVGSDKLVPRYWTEIDDVSTVFTDPTLGIYD